MKPSSLPDSGCGLFAERKFLVGDTISIYLGYIVHPKHGESQYKIRTTLPKTKEEIVLDVAVGGFPKFKSLYLGAHMFNDPMLDILPGNIDENAYNVRIINNLALVAEKVINIGVKILGSYNYDK